MNVMTLKWKTPCARRNAFTLVELMVVTVLIGLAVSMAVLRLDGVSTTSRLQSAAGQLASFLRLTQAQARTSGTPRLIEFEMDGSHITVRQPSMEDNLLSWSEGVSFELGHRVQIVGVALAGQEVFQNPQEKAELRIDSKGRYVPHVVVLQASRQFALAHLRSRTPLDFGMVDEVPVDDSYAALVAILDESNAN